MKSIVLRAFVFVVTFMIGAGFGLLADTLVTRSIDIVTGVTQLEITKSVGPETINHHRPRFEPFGRGCGNGYAQSYETNDGRFVVEGVIGEGSRRAASAAFRKIIREAKEVVERVPDYPNYLGELGERVVVRYPASANGEEWVSILWYGGDDSYRYIDAPNLELALEFERYLVANEFRSPF